MSLIKYCELQKVINAFVKQSIAQADSTNASVRFGLESEPLKSSTAFFFCMRDSVFPLIFCVFISTHKENQLHIFLSCLF